MTTAPTVRLTRAGQRVRTVLVALSDAAGRRAAMTWAGISLGGPPRGATPADLTALVRQMSLVELLQLLDPIRLDGRRCPWCGQRSVLVSNSVWAVCTACGRRFSRWQVVLRVLSDESSLGCLADAIASGRTS